MTYTVEDAVELHECITRALREHGADATFKQLCDTDSELLALALTLHMLQKVPHAATM